MGDVICNCEIKLEAMRKDVAELKELHDGFTAAFPAGDIKGHHDYHLALIERNKELARMRMAIAEKTVAGLIWAMMVWAGTAAWKQFIQTIGR